MEETRSLALYRSKPKMNVLETAQHHVHDEAKVHTHTHCPSVIECCGTLVKFAS